MRSNRPVNPDARATAVLCKSRSARAGLLGTLDGTMAMARDGDYEEFETFPDFEGVPFYVEPSALSTAMGNHELGILGYW